jgi:hypothetical protein
VNQVRSPVDAHGLFFKPFDIRILFTRIRLSCHAAPYTLHLAAFSHQFAVIFLTYEVFGITVITDSNVRRTAQYKRNRSPSDWDYYVRIQDQSKMESMIHTTDAYTPAGYYSQRGAPSHERRV